MKKIFIIRHSKAEDDAPSDFERRLTTEGKHLAEKIALKISLLPAKNAVFISSPAKRAFETAVIFAKNLLFPEKSIEKDEFLYKYYTPDRFFMWLDSIENNDEVWVFGHNPMFSELLSYLTDGDLFSMPKCTVAAFKTTAKNWFEISPENSKLLLLENPKNDK